MDREDLEAQALLVLVIAYKEHDAQRAPFGPYLRNRVMWGLHDYRRAVWGRGAAFKHLVQLSENTLVTSDEEKIRARVIVDTVLSRLPKRGRRAVHRQHKERLVALLRLRYQEERTYPEIAALWGVGDSCIGKLAREAEQAFAAELTRPRVLDAVREQKI